MTEKAITERQQYWLDHLKTAEDTRSSLVEYAKANDIEPYRYLRKIFAELPEANSLEDVEALLLFKQKPRYDGDV